MGPFDNVPAQAPLHPRKCGASLCQQLNLVSSVAPLDANVHKQGLLDLDRQFQDKCTYRAPLN